MNIRQLKKLVLETVAQERNKNRSKNRSKQLNKIMENAARQLNEYSTADEYYGDNLKAKQPGPEKTNINIFQQLGIENPDDNQQLWAQLYADSPNNASVTANENIKCNEMLPTQSQIGTANSLGNLFFGNGFPGDGFHISKDAKSKREGGAVQFATNILAARGAGPKVYIIDGHHRWSQAYMLDPNVTVNCTVLEMPGQTADDILQAVHVAISENTGNPVEKPYSLGKKFNGLNLLDPGEFPPASGIGEYIETLQGPITDPKSAGQALGGSISQEMKDWSNGVISAEQLASSGGSTLPVSIGGADCTIEQYKQHFVDAVGSMQTIYAGGDTKSQAPYRNMMPQADDMKKDGTEGMGTGGLGVFNHIAQGKITVKGSAGAEQVQESVKRKENLLKEENEILSRWKKLAGI